MVNGAPREVSESTPSTLRVPRENIEGPPRDFPEGEAQGKSRGGPSIFSRGTP